MLRWLVALALAVVGCTSEAKPYCHSIGGPTCSPGVAVVCDPDDAGPTLAICDRDVDGGAVLCASCERGVGCTLSDSVPRCEPVPP